MSAISKFFILFCFEKYQFIYDTLNNAVESKVDLLPYIGQSLYVHDCFNVCF